MTAPRFGRMGQGAQAVDGAEKFEELASAGGARVERIASRLTSPGRWYAQGWDEFVLLVAGGATLGFGDGSTRDLAPGDWALLPAGCRHRVLATAPGQETLWLAVHLPGTAPA